MFNYSEKAPPYICPIVTVKSKMEISQNFVAFREYMGRSCCI